MFNSDMRPGPLILLPLILRSWIPKTNESFDFLFCLSRSFDSDTAPESPMKLCETLSVLIPE